MARLSAKRFSWGLPALLAGWAVVSFPTGVRAQSGTQALGPTTAEEGPTREALAPTAGASLEESGTTPRLVSRYLAFQRGFDRDFGVVPGVTDRVGPILGLMARLEQQWGGTTIYQWAERALALYARVQASTKMEKKGFDIEFRTEEMAGGKLGVRMSRPLGSASTE